MRSPPSKTDIMAVLYSEMSTWPKAGMTEAKSQQCFTALADRLIDHFHLHYFTTDMSTTLPGLPGAK